MTTSSRRPLTRLAAAVGIALAALLAPLVVASAPAAAGGHPCNTSTLHGYVCSGYSAYARRTPTAAELGYWVNQHPFSPHAFNLIVGHGPESLHRTIRAYYDAFANQEPSAADLDYWDDEILKPNGLRRLEAGLLGSYTGMIDGFLDQVFHTELGRAATQAERDYWGTRTVQTSRTMVAADVGFTLEARRAKVVYAFFTEHAMTPSAATRDLWAERLRTGLSYLDLRIALRLQAPFATGWCSPAPRPGQGCPLG